MIITITGIPGSGKTTAARLLAERLNVPWYSMGDLRGKMAQERGMTIDELNALGETEKFTDEEVDEYQRKLGESGKDFVIEGRLSWHFIPHSFKIFLTVDSKEAGARLYKARQGDGRSDEPLYASPEEAENYAAGRMASDSRRYQKYYGVDFLDPKNYNLAIDTTGRANPNQTVDEILAAMQKHSVS